MATPVLVNGYTGVLATAISVRGQSCDVVGYHIYNASDATAFVQFYDEGPPTVGTTVAKWVVPVLTLDYAFLPLPAQGLFFRNALWVAATTTVGGNTPPSAALTVALALS